VVSSAFESLVVVGALDVGTLVGALDVGTLVGALDVGAPVGVPVVGVPVVGALEGALDGAMLVHSPGSQKPASPSKFSLPAFHVQQLSASQLACV
jgi:hypothetical protein